MKHCFKKSYLLYACMGLMLASCKSDQNGNDAQSTTDSADVATEMINDAKNAVKAVVKNEAFYEQMLDIFCRQNYDQLFKDIMGSRTYVAGSLKVDSISHLDGTDVMVYGKHNFEGRLGKEHENRTFVALIKEVADKANEYTVTFAKERKSLVSLVGKEDSESRTANFYYDPSSKDLAATILDTVLKDNAYYERMLDKFCQQNYNDLFKDLIGKRKYVAGSLKVDSVASISDREVKVYGKHDFEGRTGKDHSDRLFEANIFETKNKPNEYVVTFKKEGKKLVTGKPFSETRSTTYIYEE